jgi:hypothetical protein
MCEKFKKIMLEFDMSDLEILFGDWSTIKFRWDLCVSKKVYSWNLRNIWHGQKQLGEELYSFRL